MNNSKNVHLDQNELNAIKTFKESLSGRFPGAEIILYGSKARGDSDEFSDIDLLSGLTFIFKHEDCLSFITACADGCLSNFHARESFHNLQSVYNHCNHYILFGEDFMVENDLQQAIAAIKSGDKTLGRSILVRIVQQQPKNELAWLWLSACVSTDEQRRDCLKKVLALKIS